MLGADNVPQESVELLQAMRIGSRQLYHGIFPRAKHHREQSVDIGQQIIGKIQAHAKENGMDIVAGSDSVQRNVGHKCYEAVRCNVVVVYVDMRRSFSTCTKGE